MLGKFDLALGGVDNSPRALLERCFKLFFTSISVSKGHISCKRVYQGYYICGLAI